MDELERLIGVAGRCGYFEIIGVGTKRELDITKRRRTSLKYGECDTWRV